MIEVISCPHNNYLSIQGQRRVSTEGASANSVYLCRDCGQFLIIGHQDGQHYRITFTLVTDEHVEAARKPVERYKGTE